VLNVAGSPGPVAIRGVQHLFHPPVELPAWPDDTAPRGSSSSPAMSRPEALARGLAGFQGYNPA
jgi:hypothetical protein